MFCLVSLCSSYRDEQEMSKERAVLSLFTKPLHSFDSRSRDFFTFHSQHDACQNGAPCVVRAETSSMHCFSAQQGAKQSSHERGAASAARLVKREIRHTGNRALHHQDFTRARRCGRRRHDGSSRSRKSKREASRQFAAKFRASCKKEKARLQRRVDSMREDALNWKIKRMIAEDRCAELEKKIAAKRLALRQR